MSDKRRGKKVSTLLLQMLQKILIYFALLVSGLIILIGVVDPLVEVNLRSAGVVPWTIHKMSYLICGAILGILMEKWFVEPMRRNDNTDRAE